MENSQTMRAKSRVWFEDGDLIIKVVKEEEIFLHRVHSAILRHHSEVFRNMDMFSGGGEQEKIQGCPAVQLHDAPKDVFLFLKALYFPGAIPHQKLRQATFDILEPIIRLADKYQMCGLVDQLIPILEKDWPSSLAEWDANEVEVKTAIHILEPEKFERRFGDYEEILFADQLLPEPCRVIRLARDCGFPSLLPAAFYHLSRTQLERDEEPDDRDYDVLFRGDRRAATKYLQLEDWQSLNRGVLEIRKWCWYFMFHLEEKIDASHKPRKDGENVKCSIEECIDSMSEDLVRPYMSRGMDPVKILLSYTETKGVEVCYSCKRRLDKKIQKGREELWNHLPAMFDLPNVPAKQGLPSFNDSMNM